MTAFDFLLILLSFVFALALGHVLTSAGRLMVARHRVRFSGLLALAMLNAVTTVYISWLAMWDFRDTQGIDLYAVTNFFVSSVLIYIFCMGASPEPADEGEVDMEAFFWAQHRFFYGAFSVLIVTFIASTVVYLRTSQPHLFVEQAASNLPFLAAGLIGMIARNRRVQWVVGIALFVMSVAWTMTFSWTF